MLQSEYMVKVNGDFGCVICPPSHTCSVFTALDSPVPLAPVLVGDWKMLDYG